jgi:multidrug efflux pump subunit AcrA (membrane-fusion protein)
MEGLAVVTTIYRHGEAYQAQEGDEVSPNQPFMKVVDPKSIQLDAAINQVASEDLRIGMPAKVHFDAFPELELPAKVYSLGAVAGNSQSSNWVRTIPVKVVFLAQHPKVIPDLSASADIVVRKHENSVLLPLEAVFQQNGKPVVYVKSKDGFTMRAVELGRRNNTHVAIASGVKSGEQVALSRPSSVK